MITLNNQISYLPSSESPLSADVVIINGDKNTWIYDTGSCEEALTLINSFPDRNIIISHFHKDHIENLKKISYSRLFVSNNTSKYTEGAGEIIEEDIEIFDGLAIKIIPFPSAHAKGCLALEVNEEYLFVGDALYPMHKGEQLLYSVQRVKEQIDALELVKADNICISHKTDFIRQRKDILEELKRIFADREKNNPYIPAKGIFL